MNRKPKWGQRPPCCVFLGHWKDKDAYYCPSLKCCPWVTKQQPAYVIQHNKGGSSSHHWISTGKVAWIEPENMCSAFNKILRVAYRDAKKRGLIE